MNIEKIIKENKSVFIKENAKGHQARFAMKLQAQINRKNKIRRLCLSIPSAIAAMLILVLLIKDFDTIGNKIYTPENQKVLALRNAYDKQVDEAIILLETVSENLDDSTRLEINKVIENLHNTSEIFAEIAPLPEEKQLAITSKIYDNHLETLNSLYRKINKQ